MNVINPHDNYQQWNDALLDAFFPEGLDGEPAYLAVDDENLKSVGTRLGLTPDAAAASLQAAVKHQIGVQVDRLRHFLTGLDSWRSTRETPPYLALLALFSLAASRMETSEGISGNDYYSRLNPLLDRDVGSRMPPNFEHMERIWKDLANWLDLDLGGARGSSTIVRHEHFVNIGYPLSQCALRACDRNRLPDFFRSARLEPGDTVSDSRLLVLLQAWSVRPSAGLSANGIAAIAAQPESDRSKAVLTIVQRQLELWDGQLRDPEGRKRGELVLVLEIRGGKPRGARLFATCPEGFPLEAEWTNQGGVSQPLVSNGNGWYGEIASQKIGAVLSTGARLTSGNLVLSYEPAPVVPLKKEFLPVSGWTAQRRVEPLSEYNLLVRNSKVDEVGAYLSRFAESSGRQIELAGIDLPSWSLFEGVVLGSNAPPDPPEGLERLVPRLNTTSRIEGGLRVGSHIYITRGEPDLYITVGEGEVYEVILDGSPLVGGDSARKLALSELDIPVGSHTLDVAGRTFRFATIETFGDVGPSRDHQLGHRIECGSSYRPAALVASPLTNEPASTGVVEVIGAHVRAHSADLPEVNSPPVVLRAGSSRYAILGASPQHCLTLGPRIEPSWLQKISGAGLTFQFFEEEFDFTPAYVVRISGNGQKSVAAIGPALLPSDAGMEHGADTSAWVREVLVAEHQGVQVAENLVDIWPVLVDLATAHQVQA